MIPGERARFGEVNGGFRYVTAIWSVVANGICFAVHSFARPFSSYHALCQLRSISAILKVLTNVIAFSLAIAVSRSSEALDV